MGTWWPVVLALGVGLVAIGILAYRAARGRAARRRADRRAADMARSAATLPEMQRRRATYLGLWDYPGAVNVFAHDRAPNRVLVANTRHLGFVTPDEPATVVAHYAARVALLGSPWAVPLPPDARDSRWEITGFGPGLTITVRPARPDPDPLAPPARPPWEDETVGQDRHAWDSPVPPGGAIPLTTRTYIDLRQESAPMITPDTFVPPPKSAR